MLSDAGGGGLTRVLDVQSLFFLFIKENWISAMTRHTKPSTNILYKSSF